MTLEILNIISVVIQIILFIALIIAVFSLSSYVKSLMKRFESLQEDFNKFKQKVDPLIDDSKVLIQRVNKIADKVDDNVVHLTHAVDKVRKAVDDVVDFKDKIVRKAEPPILDSISAFAAIVKGVKVFTDTWKSHKPERHHYRHDDELLFDTTSDSDFELEKEYEDINKELNEVRKKLEEMKKV